MCAVLPFKQECWGDKIEYLPQQVFDDEGKPVLKPRYYWYTHVANRKKTMTKKNDTIDDGIVILIKPQKRCSQ